MDMTGSTYLLTKFRLKAQGRLVFIQLCRVACLCRRLCNMSRLHITSWRRKVKQIRDLDLHVYHKQTHWHEKNTEGNDIDRTLLPWI